MSEMKISMYSVYGCLIVSELTSCTVQIFAMALAHTREQLRRYMDMSYLVPIPSPKKIVQSLEEEKKEFESCRWPQ